MSAFIVSNDTMRRVVNAILNSNSCTSFAGVDVTAGNAGTSIGRELFAMNAAAVRERYGEDDPIGSYLHRRAAPGGFPQMVDGYKAIQCLLYQSSEGRIPGTELYRELSAFSDGLARRIVSALPEYASASWD